MTEAASWSVVKWLREKKRVRQTADRANAALDRVSQSVKDSWGDELKVAYRELSQPAHAPVNESFRRAPLKPSSALNGQATLFVKKVKEADDEAYRARMDAENTLLAKRRAFEQATGVPFETLARLPDSLPMPRLQPEDVEAWAAQAKNHAFDVQLKQLDWQIARMEVSKALPDAIAACKAAVSIPVQLGSR